MTWLSTNAAFHQPPEFHPLDPTIVLCTWMGASARHVDFYLAKYGRMVPRARVIVVMGRISNMYWVSRRRFSRTLNPVIFALQSAAESPVYVHLFSNAGAYAAVCLLQQGMKNVQYMVLDSAPSYADYATLMAGWRYVISGWYFWWIGMVLGQVLALRVLLAKRLCGGDNRRDVLSWTYGLLLEKPEIPRIYLYSQEDELVQSEHVVQHAAASRQAGAAVRLERFQGTGHCRHGKDAEEQYWAVILCCLDRRGESMAEYISLSTAE